MKAPRKTNLPQQPFSSRQSDKQQAAGLQALPGGSSQTHSQTKIHQMLQKVRNQSDSAKASRSNMEAPKNVSSQK